MSNETTCVLDGAITDTDTTINVTDASQLANAGFIQNWI